MRRGGRRGLLGCRRRELAAMTTVSGVGVLCLYCLALTWCLARPHWLQDGGDTRDTRPPAPPLSARKLQFQPLQKLDTALLAAPPPPPPPSLPSPSSSLSLSLSSSAQASKVRTKLDSGNTVQRHHRTLQFSRNVKDGYSGVDNAGSSGSSANTFKTNPENRRYNSKGRGKEGGVHYHNGVKVMQQNKHPELSPSSSSSSSARISEPIYLDERSEEEEEEGGGAFPGQEYLTGPGMVNNNNNINSSSSKASGSRRLPGAIIIGVKKAGTRALLEFLRIHPDVQAPGPEPHFFDRNYHRGLEWYRSLMPVTQPGQLTMEKTPSYFITREVPKRVQSVLRGVRLVVVVRDPVTRAISDYVQACSKREGHMRRFEDMALLDQRLGIVNTSWGAIRIGVYSKHLERWLHFFSRSQMHFVSGEQLIADPAQVVKDVQAFLGLRPFITERHFYLNATRGFPCLVKNPERHSKPHCLGKTKGRRHPQVDAHVIERLRDFYRPFNSKFYQMVGRDFGWS